MWPIEEDILEVVPKASRERKFPPKKEFDRMCAAPPTSALPKTIFLCGPAFSRSVWWCCFGGWLVVFPLCVGGGDVMCCDDVV